jgi:hypothetical protein
MVIGGRAWSRTTAETFISGGNEISDFYAKGVLVLFLLQSMEKFPYKIMKKG